MSRDPFRLPDCLEHIPDAIGRKVNPTCYTLQEFEQRRADPDSFVNKVLAQPTINLR